MGKKWWKIRALLLLLTGLLLGPAPARASLTGRKTLQALEEFADWVRIQKVTTGGVKRLPNVPVSTYGDEKDFSSLLKRRIGDGKIRNVGWYYPRMFQKRMDAWVYAESLSYVYNPTIEMMFTLETFKDEDGKWIVPVLLDNAGNYLIYKNRSSVKKLVKQFRADFRKEFEQLRRLYDKQGKRLSEPVKAAAAANYLSSRLRYRNGVVKYKGKKLYAGGNVRTAILTGKGNCYDYAYLFRELCSEIGLKCRIVEGTIRQNDRLEYHTWNAVRVNNAYYYFDGTGSDAGSNTGIGKYFNHFVGRLSHFPAKYKIYLVLD